MLELVLVLPIALLLIGALVDFGLAIHRGERVSNIARHAARLAAIVSFEDDSTANPYACPGISATPACEDDGQWLEDECSDLSSLSCLALKEAHGGLVSANFDPTHWTVKSRVCDIEVGGSPHAAVNVEIERREGIKTCILCLSDVFDGAIPSARALFAVEGRC